MRRAPTAATPTARLAQAPWAQTGRGSRDRTRPCPSSSASRASRTLLPKERPVLERKERPAPQLPVLAAAVQALLARVIGRCLDARDRTSPVRAADRSWSRSAPAAWARPARRPRVRRSGWTLRLRQPNRARPPSSSASHARDWRAARSARRAPGAEGEAGQARARTSPCEGAPRARVLALARLGPLGSRPRGPRAPADRSTQRSGSCGRHRRPAQRLAQVLRRGLRRGLRRAEAPACCRTCRRSAHPRCSTGRRRHRSGSHSSGREPTRPRRPYRAPRTRRISLMPIR